jgi:hypothetical protein
MKRLLFLSLLLLLVSCMANVRPTANNRAYVTVWEPFTFTNLGGNTVNLAAGNYPAVMEDDNGVLYRAPNMIVSSGDYFIGGLYFKNGTTGPPRLWSSQPGVVIGFTVPDGLKYSIIRE